MSVEDAVAGMPREPRPLSPLDDFETYANQTGRESEILTLRTDTVHALRETDLKVAIPAYETFTTDGTAGNTETFTLSNDLVDSPNVGTSLVLYEGGTRVSPDAVSFSNDTFDYTDDGTSNTLRVYYIVGNAATLKVKKQIPGGKTEASEELKTMNVGIVNEKDQQEDPVTLSFSNSWLERFLATDMELVVTVDADYTVRFEESTDGTKATNALFHTTATKGMGSAEGLLAAIREDMGQR